MTQDMIILENKMEYIYIYYIRYDELGKPMI